MSHENGEALYWTAFGMASFAATVLIRRPWAFYIVAMIGVMISSPGRMSDSAKSWRTTENGGTASELADLQKMLEELKATLQDKEKATWEGAAFEQFQVAYDAFTKSIESLKSTRDTTGEAVDQSAKLYHAGAYACMGIASFLMAIGVTLEVLRRNLLTAAFAQKLSEKLGRAAAKAGKNLLVKHGMALTVFVGLLYMVTQQSETAGKLFPTLTAIPTELDVLKSGGVPEFGDSASLVYDETSGKLTPARPDLQSGGLALPGQG
ncbi:hypothetical protein FXF51_21995 [Nonomuraea sp. PA05]|uniref:WXG100 family type VII secretion target n=1 Tax=Nonomuraea sp. PA05 TaxID=2604466 RepID=UPI0011DACA1C|nr:WXG100 family type VII secretion target [Nonomuraea sp. PA05]TYB64387.1 hypothetical protein FXF51_21995 [Nonomuraea sp. PA05]